jgi:competence protein ComQ
MNPEVWKEINEITDRYFTEPDLNGLLKQSIADKAEETSIWSEITLYIHRMFGGNNPCLYRLGALTELLILGLDIMDDLQDKDNTGKVWMAMSEAAAMNVMNGMLMASLAELGEMKKEYAGQPFPCASEVSRMITTAINGQHIDIMGKVQTEEEYVAMVQQKSCTLIRLSFYLGYSSAGPDLVSDLEAEQLQQFAVYAGMLAQLQNDIQDLTRYDIKNDLLYKKRTLPILYLLAEDESDFPPIHQFYRSEITWEEFLTYKLECLKYIDECGCVEYVSAIRHLYAIHANQLLDEIRVRNEWKERLRDILLGAYNDEVMEEAEIKEG